MSFKWQGRSEQDWASDVLSSLTEKHAVALDRAGWKIVAKDEPFNQWPFESKACGHKCRDWCNDLSKPSERESSNGQPGTADQEYDGGAAMGPGER